MQQLKLLGGASLETEAGPVKGRPVQRKRLALLALLAMARSRGVGREKLIAFLWPESDADSGRRFLSDSIYRINRALGDDTIVPVGDELRLHPHLVIADAVLFEDALAKGEIERAVALYAGPFLDGFFVPDAPEFERWAEAERARLSLAFAQALETIATTAEARGDRTGATLWWRRLAGHDPLNSRVALRLVQALEAAGERASALQQARVHTSLLREELGVSPDDAFASFVENLRSNPSSHLAGGPIPRPAAEHGSLAKEPGPISSSVVPSSGYPDAMEPLRQSDASAAGDGKSPKSSASRPRFLLSVAGLAVAVLAVVTISLARRGDRETASRPLTAVAVLPFANLSTDPENEYFSDGITEELINTLTRVEGLEVASRTSAFTYKDRSVDVRQIGRQLGVGAIVEGSVRKSGRALRITVQLVRADNGYHFWSQHFDRQIDDVFAVQDEIARAIVTRLAGTLIGGGTVRPVEQPAADPEAYDLYLRGRYAWHQRSRTGLVKAIEYFGDAVAGAPDYARAHAGLADAYAVSAFYDYVAPLEAYPRAESAATRALALDPALAAPHATLGYVLTYYHLDWDRAEEEFKRALALDPDYSTAHQWYANLLTVSGRFAEAQREMRAAQEADPLSLIANAALGWSLFYARDFEAALDQCRRTLALNPDFELAHLWGGWALEQLGRHDEAVKWVGRAVTLSRGSDLTRLALAYLRAASEPDSARAIVREVERRGSRGEYIPSYEIAKVYAALGDRSRGFQWLDRARRERSHSLAFLGVDPQLDMLRGDERFASLCRAVATTAVPRVARDGIEPPTRGFSVRCSTN